MKTEILATYTNKEDGLEAYVSRHVSGGFAVSLKDTDAGEFVPVVTIYKDLGTATDKARALADVA